MTLNDLIARLQDHVDTHGDAEVLIAHQPGWPLAIDVETVATDDDTEPDDDPTAPPEPEIVWIVGGTHPDWRSPYAPGSLFSRSLLRRSSHGTHLGRHRLPRLGSLRAGVAHHPGAHLLVHAARLRLHHREERRRRVRSHRRLRVPRRADAHRGRQAHPHHARHGGRAHRAQDRTPSTAPAPPPTSPASPRTG